ncbi:YciI family protein [Amnibacterium setariae]|uniref:Transcription initiation protein n=1 Tax=Amnibacterium setariae TaxID=2306585 RepID=A0A3A1U1S3_9MICO|nr:transcription initiation protein [Amnibacterium setariae]RIX30865.1 transcription initiation protein [Amnibacterium setariae]
MTHWLISFPSAAMRIPEEDLPDVVRDSHAMVRRAKDAGVWRFGGGVDEAVEPVRVHADGGTDRGPEAGLTHLDGGFAVLELATREEALVWAARFAAACRCPQELRAFGAGSEAS